MSELNLIMKSSNQFDGYRNPIVTVEQGMQYMRMFRSGLPVSPSSFHGGRFVRVHKLCNRIPGHSKRIKSKYKVIANMRRIDISNNSSTYEGNSKVVIKIAQIINGHDILPLSTTGVPDILFLSKRFIDPKAPGL
jgi:hypothetical protein